MKPARPYPNQTLVRVVLLVRRAVLALLTAWAALGFLLASLAACHLETPPHATSWQPTCLVLCFSRVEVSDIRTAPPPQKALRGKPASAAPAKPASSVTVPPVPASEVSRP